MPKVDLNKLYKGVAAKAEKTRNSFPEKISQEAKRLQETVEKKKVEYDRELHEAMQMAEHFDKNKLKDGYVLKEGWDMHDMIHSLVVLWRALKGEVFSGKAEIVVPESKKTPPAP